MGGGRKWQVSAVTLKQDHCIKIFRCCILSSILNVHVSSTIIAITCTFSHFQHQPMLYLCPIYINLTSKVKVIQRSVMKVMHQSNDQTSGTKLVIVIKAGMNVYKSIKAEEKIINIQTAAALYLYPNWIRLGWFNWTKLQITFVKEMFYLVK